MCIKTKYPIEWRVAEEDIECYKVLETYKGGYWTPYRNEKVEFNDDIAILEDGSLKDMACERYATIIERSSSLDMGYTYIGEGMIHTYANLRRAKDEAYILTDERIALYHYDIFKAIIPKGTEYIVSEDGKEYASRHIKIFRQ